VLWAYVLQDAVYKPLLGQLARVSFFSAAMHQLVFTIFSTLPFAVGQPQVWMSAPWGCSHFSLDMLVLQSSMASSLPAAE
jgi:hypothetical protein